MSEKPGALRKEEEMREHEREARKRSGDERDDAGDPLASAGDERDPIGTPDDDAMPAPPANIQGANLGGAS
jgi:hypothetical protein